MLRIRDSNYTQVIQVTEDGECCGNGGYTTEIPECISTNEARKALLPQVRGNCTCGKHRFLVESREGSFDIFIAPVGLN